MSQDANHAIPPQKPVVMPPSDSDHPLPSTSQLRRPLIKHPTTNTIMINPCQKGNPVLNHIRNVPFEWSDIVPDYQLGATTGALYLSIRYHRLHPDYIHTRIQKLSNMYNLRLLFVHCDVDDHQDPIKELTKLSIIHNLTMMVAWSAEEVGRYLEIYKSFERKGPELIKERVDKDYMSQMQAVLSGIKGINKTDVVTLTSNFGSLKRIASATTDELAICPGLGEKKVKRLRDAFSRPFVVATANHPKSKAQERGEAGAQDLN